MWFLGSKIFSICLYLSKSYFDLCVFVPSLYQEFVFVNLCCRIGIREHTFNFHSRVSRSESCTSSLYVMLHKFLTFQIILSNQLSYSMAGGLIWILKTLIERFVPRFVESKLSSVSSDISRYVLSQLIFFGIREICAISSCKTK